MPRLYEITVPVFTRTLRNLDHILALGETSGVAEQTLIEAKLAPDMLALPRQVQIACDTAKFAIMRLAQTDPLPMADDETTLAQLRERIARTLAYIEAAKPAAFRKRKKAEITIAFPGDEKKFTGQSFVTDFALPNFFFHVTTTYALLRMNGVAVGKSDYLFGGRKAAEHEAA